jgi:hypothetical protein
MPQEVREKISRTTKGKIFSEETRRKISLAKTGAGNAMYGKTGAEIGTFKHGGNGTYLYQLWLNIRGRCLNQKNHRYKDYGGRGIGIHAPWIESYPVFRDAILAEIGERPSPKHSIDRIENNVGYFPGNLRWATAKEQQKNTRSRSS